MFYHIVTKETEAKGTYFPKDFEKEGFVHCSFKSQVARVANNIFHNFENLRALEINESMIDEGKIKIEDLYNSGEKFPHLYCGIPKESVNQIIKLKKESGKWVL